MLTQEQLREIKETYEYNVHHDSGLQPGFLLNHQSYEIVQLEAVTQECLVYRGIDLVKGHFVMLKEFYPKASISLNEVMYFDRDVDTMRLALKNPSPTAVREFNDLMKAFEEDHRYRESISIDKPMTHIIDSFRDCGTLYLVTTYNPWPSMKQILESQILLSFETVHEWILQLLDCIQPFHKRKVMHQNLNPKNIYVSDLGVQVDDSAVSQILAYTKLGSMSDFEGRYYAPEVNFSEEAVGPWSDVYAIGKIMIDLLMATSSSKDYFKALDQIPDEALAIQYEMTIKKAIAFSAKDRIQDVMTLKSNLSISQEVARDFRPIKQAVAMIAVMAMMSSAMVLWHYREPDYQVADYVIIEDEPTPLGAIDFEEDVRFITQNETVFEDQALIQWLKASEVAMINYEVFEDDLMVIEGDLEPDQILLPLNLRPGHYKIRLNYELDGKQAFSEVDFILQ
jgi:serine/threonine protein kinase